MKIEGGILLITFGERVSPLLVCFHNFQGLVSANSVQEINLDHVVGALSLAKLVCSEQAKPNTHTHTQSQFKNVVHERSFGEEECLPEF